MSFKSSKGRDAGKELEVYRSESVGQGVGGGGAGGVAAPGSISGGNVDDLEPGNGYHYHTFTGPGDAVVSGGDVKATIFMIAGGGGGGGQMGGGGGAGGAVLYSCTLEPGTYPITIGAGGAGSTGENVGGSSGGDTTFGPSTPVSLTAKGGGYGAVGDRGPGPGRIGGGGGCGGGGGTQPYSGGSENQSPQNPTFQVKHGFIQFGTPGGSSATSPSQDSAGGGGGTGGSGGVGRYKASPINAPNGTDGMEGGDGKLFQGFTGPLIGVPALGPLNGYFGGGGGGRANSGSPTGRLYGPGGLGGGGNAPGGDADANSGGGGASPHPGGNGGSGIVVIKWEDTI